MAKKLKYERKVGKKLNLKSLILPAIILVAVIIALYYIQKPYPKEITSEEALNILNQKIAKCGTSFSEVNKVSLFIDQSFFTFLKKSCEGVENFINSNETVEVFQASKFWKKEPEGCDVSLPHCKVYYIFGLVGEKGEFSCAYIQVGEKKIGVEEICGLEPGVNFILKDSYKQGEEIEFKIVNNLNSSIYLEFYDWDDKFVYLYKNGEWVEQEIKVYCPCPCDCLVCPSCPAKAKLCTEIKPMGIFTYTWNQKVYEPKKISCVSGNRTFFKNCDEEKLAEPGKYKAMFCYYTSYKGALYHAGCEVTGKVRCVEKEFEIK
ncbi:MAG: hypothetical protein NZ942_00250 [Candidatus Aenigmarchaeota archaeon]|nr:hypothetical protein [Candidatus Aenigmarchaeota archaeon]